MVRYHTVLPGETSMSLAELSHHGIHREANNLIRSNVDAGAKLVIPIAPGKHSTADVQTYAKRLRLSH